MNNLSDSPLIQSNLVEKEHQQPPSTFTFSAGLTPLGFQRFPSGDTFSVPAPCKLS